MCFEMLLKGIVLIWYLSVMRIAGNDLGPIGGEYVSRALMQLTGLHALNISGACFTVLMGWGMVCISGEEDRE
jgi:hypothetical protein